MSRPIPPLLVLAEGGRPRPRRSTVSRPLEIGLQLSVVDALRKVGRQDWRWTHFPAGEARDARTGAKLKRMGTARGWPDLILVSPAGLFHGLELKRIGEDLTEDQEYFRRWAIGRGVPHSVCHSLDEALRVLTYWGALRSLAVGTAR